MNDATPSIFDLSPSEKLQLVEDLWDDLAGTPEAVLPLAAAGTVTQKGESLEEPRFRNLMGRSEATGPQPLWPLGWFSHQKQNSTLRKLTFGRRIAEQG